MDIAKIIVVLNSLLQTAAAITATLASSDGPPTVERLRELRTRARESQDALDQAIEEAERKAGLPPE